jgi:CDP-diacylglycerol--serine O-phosphatidyltransferase
MGNVGWIAAMVFAICAALRLARFNVAIDDPNRPAWAGNFFTGVPAPAGAITVLLPIYIYFLGMPRLGFVAPLALIYTLVVALLMVSRLPVFSGKRIGTRVPPEMVLPIFVLVVLFVAVLISYPWPVLTVGTLCYLAALPLGWLSYRRYEQAAAAAAASSPAAPSPAASERADEPATPTVLRPGETAEERPTRLN